MQFYSSMYMKNIIILTGTLTSSQDSLTHCACVGNGGALMFPPAVKVYWSVAIQCTQRFRSPSLNGLLMLTSRGCRMPVSPPGITATSVLDALTASLTPWVRWALKLSQTRRDFSLTRPLGRCCQMLLTHNLHAASSI